MKFFSIFFIVLFLFVSCSDDPTKVHGRNMIKRDKVVKILADIHVVDAITNGPGYYRKYEAADSVDLYASIFEKYGVTKAEFDSTVAKLSRQPEIFMQIYDDVILELNYRLDTLRENEPIFEKEEEQE